MKDITFIIPVRIDSYHRLCNLLSVVRYYLSTIPDTIFIIVEGDSISRIKGIPDNNRCKCIFIKDRNPIFHRTRYVNEMFRIIDTKFAAVWDADAIGEVSNIEQAVDLLKNNGAVMSYPYNGIFWSIGQWHSEIFCDTLDLNVLTRYPQPKSLMCGYHSVGGAFIVDVELYRKYGWENEYFCGWGPEDAERFARLEILGHPPLRVDSELYHLYHPRGINSGSVDHELSYLTKKEYAKVCSMTPKELEMYISEWEWIK